MSPILGLQNALKASRTVIKICTEKPDHYRKSIIKKGIKCEKPIFEVFLTTGTKIVKIGYFDWTSPKVLIEILTGDFQLQLISRDGHPQIREIEGYWKSYRKVKDVSVQSAKPSSQ